MTGVRMKKGRIAFEQTFCDGAHIPSAIEAKMGADGYVDFYADPSTPADPSRDKRLPPSGPWGISAWRRHGHVELRWRVAAAQTDHARTVPKMPD